MNGRGRKKRKKGKQWTGKCRKREGKGERKRSEQKRKNCIGKFYIYLSLTEHIFKTFSLSDSDVNCSEVLVKASTPHMIA